MPIFKTLIFTILVPGTVTILIPRWLLSAQTMLPSYGLRYLALIPISIGAAIYLWCARDFATAGRGTPAVFDPPRELVVRGLYRFTRNPMYIGILTILVGEAALFASVRLLIYAGCVALLFHTFVVLYEEPRLRMDFRGAYRTYCLLVPRWLPTFEHLSTSGRKNRNDKA